MSWLLNSIIPLGKRSCNAVYNAAKAVLFSPSAAASSSAQPPQLERQQTPNPSAYKPSASSFGSYSSPSFASSSSPSRASYQLHEFFGTKIHPRAEVESGAEIGHGVEIGAFSYIEKDVKLEDDVKIDAGVKIRGNPPQDRKYSGEESSVDIGKACIIRENVTIHSGTKSNNGLTKIGDGTLLLANCHVAHDCIVGQGVVISNGVNLAGHVQVGDGATIGGGAGVKQFVRIGRESMVGGLAAVDADVIPYGLALGNRAHLHGINLVRARRQGLAKDEIRLMLRMYRYIFQVREGFGDPSKIPFASPLPLTPHPTLMDRTLESMAYVKSLPSFSAETEAQAADGLFGPRITTASQWVVAVERFISAQQKGTKRPLCVPQ